MYADRKGLALDDVEVRLRHERVHADDSAADCDAASSAAAAVAKDGKIERILRRIDLTGDLTEAQRDRLLAIADRCPVHRTLQSAPCIVTATGSVAETDGQNPRAPQSGDGGGV